jgi:hypothetical protein
VCNFGSNFAVSRFLNFPSATVRFIYFSLCFLFFVGLVDAAAAAADVPSAPAVSSLSFSIADFDGDLKPDLASVQAGKSDLTRTDYRIQLQLSAAGRQTFQIVAPIGGLQIFSRDVNGDHALDLVLTTTWLRQPVAILLNDGHGNFSQAAPDAFPEAFSRSTTTWCSATDHAIGAVGIPPQSQEDICSETKHFLRPRSKARFAAPSDSRFGVRASLASHSGRAPPFEVFLS